MERTQLPVNTEPESQRVFSHIFDNGVGNPIVLGSAPTTAGEELEVNQIGIFGNDLYWNINGTVRKYAGSAV